MKGNSIEYKNFVIYPEYCGYSESQLADRSLESDKYHIAAIPRDGKNEAVVFYKGSLIYSRAKYQLYFKETKFAEKGTIKPEIITLAGWNVLILICYEIIFPEDYFIQTKDVDLVVHVVGYPMYDENQREAWIALQKCISLKFKCPVVCCCGGNEGRMKITGIISTLL